MAWSFLSLLTILCIGILLRGLIVRGAFYHFPFLAAATFLTFVLPQLPGLINTPFVSDSSISKVLFFSCLCLAMCGVGWSVGVHGHRPRDHYFSEARLLHVAAALSLVGAFFFYKFGHLPDDQRLRGMHTGAAVAYLFFAKLLTYGLAIALICYAQRMSKFALAIILFDSVFYLERIFIAGKRGETAEFFLLFALAFWFQRRWAVPRPVVVASILLSGVAMLGVEEYRLATLYNSKPDWSAVMNIDLARNWDRMLEQGGPEMRNATMAIEQIDRTRRFDFGVEHWNSVVFAFVPAQLVGQSFKASLGIKTSAVFERGYDPSLGSTATGMTDAFASFWYFGCLKFFVIAWALGLIYSAAAHGNTTMQITYMLSAIPAMLAITHFTNEIVIAWIHMAAFLVPALYYARVRSTGTSISALPTTSHYRTA